MVDEKFSPALGPGSVPVSAIVTAFDRGVQTRATLRSILACHPPPAEVLVHVDGGQTKFALELEKEFPSTRILFSTETSGPGGARNKLLCAATHELVASFDDDSRPEDMIFFQRVVELAARFPDAAILAANIREGNSNEFLPEDSPIWRTDSFVGCGCIYRRDIFLKTDGYVPIQPAYGMEESDLSLRLHEAGWRIYLLPSLRVAHHPDMVNHSRPHINAASIANLGLLTFLRYPALLWPLGFARCLKRAWWLIRHGRRSGIMRGFFMIPVLAWRFRSVRKPVSARTVLGSLKFGKPATSFNHS
ncbi:glycosyltransferase [Prosthecobacter sp.]|uniref:glycosyltransferase family 2 protein n=1 Tax=Prosthecobacter sp. TaxID=1965333 RepID=UPI002AC97EFC|nr:glycosyltransferase [Prosthecobacter sp.]